jgi:hypothetical protein
MQTGDFLEVLDQVGPATKSDARDSHPLFQSRRVKIALEELVDTTPLGVSLDKENESHDSSSKTPEVKSLPREYAWSQYSRRSPEIVSR